MWLSFCLFASISVPRESFGFILGALGGLQGSILGALEVSWAPFWGLLGSILSALGVYWALLGALGAHKVPHGRSEANLASILESFWINFGGQNRFKIGDIF